MIQPERFPPQHLRVGGERGCYTKLLSWEERVEFGARSQGGRGSPAGSVRVIGLVWFVFVSLFYFIFFNISDIFLQPPVLALSRGLQPLVFV